jgi:HK97 family phage major capsid protein
MSLTDANGGYLVPFTLDPTIILTNAGAANPFRQISTIKTIATDTWNGVTSAGVSAEWTAEGVEAADATPTVGQPTITPKKADAWVFGSYEVLADSGFASELGRLLADAKDRLEAAAFATANTGATIPRGVVAAVAAVTASIVTSATTNAFVVGDVYNTSDALRPRDAAQASWAANKKIYSKIRQFDTSGGGAFWANLGMGVPNLLLGQPQYEASSMASVITTGANILLAGNFAEFYIVDRVGMSVIYDPMVKSTGNGRPTGQGGWYAFWRVGSDVVDASAFRLLQLNQVAAATALA